MCERGSAAAPLHSAATAAAVQLLQLLHLLQLLKLLHLLQLLQRLQLLRMRGSTLIRRHRISLLLCMLLLLLILLLCLLHIILLRLLILLQTIEARSLNASARTCAVKPYTGVGEADCGARNSRWPQLPRRQERGVPNSAMTDGA